MYNALRASRLLAALGWLSCSGQGEKRFGAASPHDGGGRKAAQSVIGAGLAAILATLSAGSALTEETGRAKPDPDWPCRQILVPTISLPAIWTGPSIEAVKWRGDAAITDLVARLAARRMPLEDAERMIKDFAKSKGADKAAQLTALFAGLFETLNAERAQIIDGLLRFGRRQKELAAKIREENAAIQSGSAGASPNEGGPDQKTSAETLALDLRLFEERHQSLTYVCETPTLIEQRLFALARTIQNNLN